MSLRTSIRGPASGGLSDFRVTGLRPGSRGRAFGRGSGNADTDGTGEMLRGPSPHGLRGALGVTSVRRLKHGS